MLGSWLGRSRFVLCLVHELEDGAVPTREYSLHIWDELVPYQLILIRCCLCRLVFPPVVVFRVLLLHDGLVAGSILSWFSCPLSTRWAGGGADSSRAAPPVGGKRRRLLEPTAGWRRQRTGGEDGGMAEAALLQLGGAEMRSDGRTAGTTRRGAAGVGRTGQAEWQRRDGWCGVAQCGAATAG